MGDIAPHCPHLDPPMTRAQQLLDDLQTIKMMHESNEK